MKKPHALILIFALTLFLLASCTTGAPVEAPPASEAPSSAPTVALVVSGAFGDRAFNDSAKKGCDDLIKEGISVTTIECHYENHTQQIYNAAEIADIVILVGWDFYDVETVAPEHEDKRFIWIDNATSSPVANVLNITFAQNEGSFLAGYIAARTSQSGIIGAVGGRDLDNINDFIVGYRQGALCANPDIDVQVVYSGTYDDPVVGKKCALELNELGADVIFQIAGKCGSGVFDAAKEKGFYAIGVDSDQKYIDPDAIICSMYKDVGAAIYDAVMRHTAEGDDCGLWGSTWVAGMESHYVGIGYGEEGLPQQIDDDLKHEVEELAGKIVSGEIVVDTTR